MSETRETCDAECTSGCHADDCDHHGHLPVQTREPELLAAIKDAVSVLAYMGNGEGWTIDHDVMQPLLRVLTVEERIATGMVPELAAAMDPS